MEQNKFLLGSLLLLDFDLYLLPDSFDGIHVLDDTDDDVCSILDTSRFCFSLTWCTCLTWWQWSIFKCIHSCRLEGLNRTTVLIALAYGACSPGQARCPSAIRRLGLWPVLHMDVHIIKEKVNDGIISIIHRDTKRTWADLLTKPVTNKKQFGLCKSILMSCQDVDRY